MCQSMWKSFGDASEKHRVRYAGLYSDTHQLTETIWKGKQTNKQTSGGSTCGGADAGGSAELCNMQSPIHNASEYMEELQRCIGDASEKRGVRYTGLYSDITPLLRGTSSSQATHMAWGGGRGVVKVEILHNVGGIGQVLSWEPLIIGVWPSLELHQVM